MKLIELLEFIQDENRSEEFLRSKGILKTFTNCNNCDSDKLGMIRGDRWKCYSCKSEWTRRKDSILSLVRMKYSEFILCMKFFELELTAEETASQLKLNYKTVKFLFQHLSSLFLDEDLRRSIPNEVFSGKEEHLKIYSNSGKIKLSFKDEDLKQLASVVIERKRVQGAEAYYDFKFRQLSSINNRVKIDPLLLQFIRFTRKRLYTYRGTAKKSLTMKLKEIEFRFNNLKVDTYDLLGKQISQKF